MTFSDTDRMFVTDLGGTVYMAGLDGSNRKEILVAQGNLTGIAYAQLQIQGSHS